MTTSGLTTAISKKRAVPAALLFCLVLFQTWCIFAAAPAEKAGAAKEKRADTFKYILGTQTIGVKYQFTRKTRLVETAERIREMGSNILKISMGRKYSGADYALPQRGDIKSLKDLAANEPSFRRVLDMPFGYYLIWAYTFSNGWRGEGFSGDNLQQEYKEMYDFASFLLKRYAGTGKTFLLGNWEGDWHLHGGNDPKKEPDPQTIEDMITWLNIRQKAIDDARHDAKAKNVYIYQYTEVNLVQKGMKGETCVVNNVLPYTGVDFVSYSAYDTINQHMGGAREALREALDYIESKLKAKPGINGKRVFIGEYGFPLGAAGTAEKQDEYARDVARAGIEWGCPFVLYWEFYCNETDGEGKHKGFWLIDDKNKKQPFYNTLKEYYRKSRAYIADFRKENKRLPTDEEFREKAAEFLETEEK